VLAAPYRGSAVINTPASSISADGFHGNLMSLIVPAPRRNGDVKHDQHGERPSR
jgi:hypothetical protein